MTDDNAGKQVAGRVAIRPVVGLLVGASVARGAWLADSVPGGSCGGGCDQTSTGIDLEYSRDYWVVRSEAVWTSWGLPFSAATSNGRSVRAWTGWVEGRYRLTPRVYVAGRLDRLRFSDVYPAGAGAPFPWDAPVDRVEVTAGYYLQRNLIVRAGLQGNWRDATRNARRTFAAAQITWWF